MINTKKYNNFINKKGFSTLFIVIIIGTVALSLALTLSTSSLWSIKGSTDTKNANKAKSLTMACAEVALETIRENNNYTGTDNITLDGDSCNYNIINTGGGTRSIVISGESAGVIRKLNINTSSFNPLVISSWQEI
jgi:type II secretory pathway pseudopilin PulG